MTLSLTFLNYSGKTLDLEKSDLGGGRDAFGGHTWEASESLGKTIMAFSGAEKLVSIDVKFYRFLARHYVYGYGIWKEKDSGLTIGAYLYYPGAVLGFIEMKDPRWKYCYGTRIPDKDEDWIDMGAQTEPIVVSRCDGIPKPLNVRFQPKITNDNIDLTVVIHDPPK
ncbi:hypothetical protein [Burkholderia gladioli]|uniref:hypothetical protein n=1 Tax=Burkholderia gladioli TaxID=28095 RepID=UPI00163E44FF|nr:hypothetical protein [Burkholderia gladioli]MDN7754740.1 hypothetical protein [Burkholderia gladioli]